MNRDKLLRQWLPESISLNPIGSSAGEIWIEEFNEIYLKFFDSIMEIQKADISSLAGFGELTENNQPQYASFHEFITETFADNREDYWKNWKELFDTSMMTKAFFETYYEKMLYYSRYCKDQRCFVNNNLFFGIMVIWITLSDLWTGAGRRLLIGCLILPVWIFTVRIFLFLKS